MSAENVKNSLVAPFRGFKDDPLGSLLRAADTGQRLPETRTKTSYALTLHATAGNRRGVIGAVHDVSTRQGYQVEEEYEINAQGRGLPRELVPQLVSTRTLTLRRYDLYTKTMEQVFGLEGYFDPSEPLGPLGLVDQIGPISMRMTWKTPEPLSVASVFLSPKNELVVYEYCDCYITELGRTVSTGDVIVKADATMVWRSVRRLQ